ncbi:MAG: alpha/beta fold hydrolase [Burkholderiaceae bacterium]
MTTDHDTAPGARSASGPGPAGVLAELDAAARRVVVPTPGGVSVWRSWGSGPPVVLLHGGTGSWRHWVSNVHALAASYTVWAPDMPGYGDSDDAPAGADPAALAQVLSQALDTVLPGSAPVDLVGFSFGGIVASHLAAQRPDRTRRLILVGAVGLGALRRPRDREMRRWRGLDDAQASRAAHRHNLAVLMIADAARIDELAIEVQQRNAQRTRFLSRGLSRGHALREILPQVAAPISAVWGRFDATSSDGIETVVDEFRALLPQARWHVIDEAGHWVQYEEAGAFNALLLEWLAEPAAGLAARRCG